MCKRGGEKGVGDRLVGALHASCHFGPWKTRETEPFSTLVFIAFWFLKKDVISYQPTYILIDLIKSSFIS